ncbi:D-alanine--D-alanine ligase family protein [uncultured Gulosibacter sp.]|uniref:D-alanine--D-alanine ligase family protein n=1 Tax=uncultured Gulosibacter sp. TaxID=1339167 RepID=UPI00288B7739|nr:D-alanine--D-alanine ligase family protein [uncultured Gulosibacter sp.]
MTATNRRTVLVLFGGRSSEHTISCATAAGVLGAIDREKFDVIPVGITREGAWVLEEDNPAKFQLDPEHMPEVVDNGTRVLLPDSVQSRTLRVVREGTVAPLADVDVVFPLIHGPFGEDGTLQGMLAMTSLPFVGSGVLASAAGMDKHYTKLLLAAAGLRVAKGITVFAEKWRDARGSVAEQVAELGWPVFVKPARAGSSVGVSKVADAAGLDEAMRVAFAEDDHVLVEESIAGREVEIAVLGGRRGEPARASVAGEIVMQGAEFYDFAAKYLDDSAVRLDCPAQLSEAQLAVAQQLAVRAFDALGCEGLARVDFFLDGEGFLVNEVNTMPGFTPISMFPKCWGASGLPYDELITELIEVALSRAAG